MPKYTSIRQPSWKLKRPARDGKAGIEGRCVGMADGSFEPGITDAALCTNARYLENDPKTFNNHSGFERGFCQRKLRWFGHVPQTRVFKTVAKIGSADKSGFYFSSADYSEKDGLPARICALICAFASFSVNWPTHSICSALLNSTFSK